MAKFFYKEPDTKEDVERKISVLSDSIAFLLRSTQKMQADLLANHLEYTGHLIEMKRDGLKEAQASISRKKALIEKYKIKLTKFKTVHLD